jgi:hypothetical protein
MNCCLIILTPLIFVSSPWRPFTLALSSALCLRPAKKPAHRLALLILLLANSGNAATFFFPLTPTPTPSPP